MRSSDWYIIPLDEFVQFLYTKQTYEDVNYNDLVNALNNDSKLLQPKLPRKLFSNGIIKTTIYIVL